MKRPPQERTPAVDKPTVGTGNGVPHVFPTNWSPCLRDN